MNLLLEMVADQTGLPVVRPQSVETTAIGAATLAGLAEGVWGSLDDLGDQWTREASFSPTASAEQIGPGHQAWHRAVERSKHWGSRA